MFEHIDMNKGKIKRKKSKNNLMNFDLIIL
jgi:hypothetical protein